MESHFLNWQKWMGKQETRLYSRSLMMPLVSQPSLAHCLSDVEINPSSTAFSLVLSTEMNGRHAVVVACFVSMVWCTAAFLSFSVVMKTKHNRHFLSDHLVTKARKVSGMTEMIDMMVNLLVCLFMCGLVDACNTHLLSCAQR